MTKSSITIVSSLFAIAVMASAEPQRTFLTTENQFPERGRLELGYGFDGRAYDGLDLYTHSLNARLGLLKDFTVRVQVPGIDRQPEMGNSEFGLGDVSLGFDLVAYQDVFSFPFLIPHADISFATGEEEKGLGAGETEFRIGVAIGTKTHEAIWWVLDASYSTGDLLNSDEILDLGLSVLWELSDQFTVAAEGLIRHMEETDSEAVLAGASATYKWTPSFLTGVFAGKWNENDTGEDTVLKVSAAYAF
ncbi:MAG: hypothetical protein NZ740_07790 [Kiritimatiellae bacterium]|nr:hypothetical protein [Kiritimatiellia bacterium]MDW8458996.1 hypothetical protein [Verrucomicrobiota bacterium]